MNAQDWEILKEDAHDIVDNMDISNMNDDDFLMVGASAAILNYKPKNENSLMDLCDYVPSSEIDELKQESLQYFVEYIEQKTLEQTKNAPLHGEYAFGALKDMLKVDEKIAEILYKSASQKEKTIIKNSYHNILGRL